MLRLYKRVKKTYFPQQLAIFVLPNEDLKNVPPVPRSALSVLRSCSPLCAFRFPLSAFRSAFCAPVLRSPFYLWYNAQHTCDRYPIEYTLCLNCIP